MAPSLPEIPAWLCITVCQATTALLWALSPAVPWGISLWSVLVPRNECLLFRVCPGLSPAMCCSSPSSAEVASCPSHHLPKGFLVLGLDVLGRAPCITAPPSSVWPLVLERGLRARGWHILGSPGCSQGG